MSTQVPNAPSEQEQIVDDNDTSFYDPDFEFDCPKYADLGAIGSPSRVATPRRAVQRQTLNQSLADDWFQSDGARQLEFFGDKDGYESKHQCDPLLREELAAATAATAAAVIATNTIPQIMNSRAIQPGNAFLHAAVDVQAAKSAESAAVPSTVPYLSSQPVVVPSSHLPTISLAESNDQQQHKKRKLNNGDSVKVAAEQPVPAAQAKHTAATADLQRNIATLATLVTATARSAKPLTLPKPFKFHTDERIRLKHRHQPTPSQAQQLGFAFDLVSPPSPEMARSYSVVEQKQTISTAPSTAAQTKPIAATTKTLQPQSASHAPLATLLAQQVTNLPSSRAQSKPISASAVAKQQQPKPTVPQEFHLHTAPVSIKPKPLSREEREALEMAQMPKFKARPVNKKILYDNNGQLGVPKVSKKPPTVAVSPKLGTARKRPREEFEKDHANDQPSAKLAGSVSQKPKAPAAAVRQPPQADVSIRPIPRITIPKTPKLSTAARARARANTTVNTTQAAVAQAISTLFKARPMPRVEPFKLKPAARPVTQPQPFNLESEQRGLKHQIELDQKLAKEKAESVVQPFKARPVLLSQQPRLPFIRKQPLTEPEPFQLKSEVFREKALQEWREQVQREQEQRKRMSVFHARPLPSQVPFVLKQSTTPLTIPADLKLRSDIQAMHRHEFDLKNQQRLDEIERERQRQQEEQERLMREEIARMRREQMTFHARPLPLFYQQAPHPSSAAPATLASLLPAPGTLAPFDPKRDAFAAVEARKSVLEVKRFARKAEQQQRLQRALAGEKHEAQGNNTAQTNRIAPAAPVRSLAHDGDMVPLVFEISKPALPQQGIQAPAASPPFQPQVYQPSTLLAQQQESLPYSSQITQPQTSYFPSLLRKPTTMRRGLQSLLYQRRSLSGNAPPPAHPNKFDASTFRV